MPTLDRAHLADYAKGVSTPKRRAYHQYCGAARALDVVGERWTLLIVRNLLLGPRRYSDLLTELPGITTNLLAKRLKEMTAAGLIEHDLASPPPRAELYALTARGRALEPVLLDLVRWGGALMGRPRRDDTLNPGWALWTLKAFYRGGVELELELRVDGRTFEMRFLPEELRVQERRASRPDVIVTASQQTLGSLFFNREPLRSLLRNGEIEVEGDTRALQAAVAATAR
jgi:DNA-binding HxlR family transcriptional regulator